jgi:hypothetical protein
MKEQVTAYLNDDHTTLTQLYEKYSKEAVDEEIEIQLLRKKYLANEDSNRHAENFCLLANKFGDESEKFICNANLNFKKRFNYVDSDLSRAAYQAANKYYQNIK